MLVVKEYSSPREGINILEESQSKDQQSAIADRRFGTSFCIEPYKCTQGAIDVVEWEKGAEHPFVGADGVVAHRNGFRKRPLRLRGLR